MTRFGSAEQGDQRQGTSILTACQSAAKSGYRGSEEVISPNNLDPLWLGKSYFIGKLDLPGPSRSADSANKSVPASATWIVVIVDPPPSRFLKLSGDRRHVREEEKSSLGVLLRIHTIHVGSSIRYSPPEDSSFSRSPRNRISRVRLS